MTIEKLPSGSYRIRQQYNGKRYTITVPYKPTKKEALELMAEKVQDKEKPKNKYLSFYDAAFEYVASKENILSPRTVREYEKYPARLPNWFTRKSVYDINQDDVQECINELAKDKAPKTVRTLHGFISAVMKKFQKGITLNTTLPQKVRKEPNIPVDDDVRTILQYTKENAPHYYVALILACYSCRRSEICALQYPEDIKGNVVTINKALVEDRDSNWVIKTTKTTESTRHIILSDDVVNLIHEQGYFYNGSPARLTKYLKSTQKKLGLTDFSVHKLRHYFASKMMDMGVDQKTIQEMGGWKGNEILSNIYQHSMLMKSEERKKELAEKLSQSIL